MPKQAPRSAAIYVRISQDREGGNLGVQRQEEDCRALAKREGMTVARVYVDNDRSAYSGKPRPEYLAMLDDVRTGAVDAVVVWHTDRLHRSVRELSDYIDACKIHETPTITVKAGTLDLSSATGRMQAGFAGLIAQHESEHRAERLQRKHQQSAEAGLFRGGTRPFGYEAGGMTVNIAEADDLKRMTAAVIAGESLASLMRDLNHRGVTTTMGNQWSYPTVRQLLMRPRNAGLSEYRGEVVGAAQWPAIVAEDDWRAVCSILKDPSRRRSNTNATKHLLSGIAKCGVCGQGLKSAVVVDRSGIRRPIYRCHVYPTAKHLDASVNFSAYTVLLHPGVRAALAPPQDDDARARQAEVEALRRRLDGVADAIADGDLSPVEGGRASARIRTKLDALESASARHASSRVIDQLVTSRHLADTWAQLSLAKRREVINTLMTVTVLPVGKGNASDVKIELKTELERLTEYPGFEAFRNKPTQDQLTELTRLLTPVATT